MTSSSSGVQKKIRSKIKTINELGIDCKGVSFSNSISAPLIVNEYLTLIPYQEKKRRFFNTFLQQKILFKAISDYLDSQIDTYDYVLFRYPLASLSLLNLSKRLNKKIIFEHNTKEIEEIVLQSKLFRASLKFSFKPGYFIYLLERGYLSIWQEKFFGKKIFNYAKFGIAVTNEIAEYEKNRQPNYKVDVVTNGIDVLNCTLRKPISFNGSELKLFMLLGSGSTWHGVDRIVKSLEKYKGDCKITIDIIGSIQENDRSLIMKSTVHKFIRVIPPVLSSELDAVLNQYHLGIGTLAAFRIGLQEAAPLKIREYMARGFATIIGYSDSDFEHRPEFKNYYLKVKADESLINFEEVVSFTKNLYLDTEHHYKIRELAIKYLDTKVKMRELFSAIDV